MAYVAISFVVIEVLYFGVWCRPFWHYWQPCDAEKGEAPKTSDQPRSSNLRIEPQCYHYQNHVITSLILDVSSDLFILFIPLPILVRAKFPFHQKSVLVILFVYGFIVISFGVLGKYNALGSRRRTRDKWPMWYFTEAANAVLICNYPHFFPLLRRIFGSNSIFARLTAGSPKTRDLPSGSRLSAGFQQGGDRTWHVSAGLPPKGKDKERRQSRLQGESESDGIPLAIRKDVEFTLSEVRTNV